MTLASLFTDHVEILRWFRGVITDDIQPDMIGRDVYGNPTDGHPAVGEGQSVYGRLSHQAGEEDDVDRNTQTSRWLLYLPPGITIGARDRVHTHVGMMEVDGRPIAHRSPVTGASHITVQLRKVDE